MTTRILVVALTILATATPALAASVGLSLPSYRTLFLQGDGYRAMGWGGLSAPIISTGMTLSPLVIDVGLDYAYVRDLHAQGGNYSFFDARAGLGLPLRLGPTLELIPGVEGHALMTIHSPEGLDGLAYGYGPSLAARFRLAEAVRLELGYGLTLVPNWRASNPLAGTLGTLRISGSYSF